MLDALVLGLAGAGLLVALVDWRQGMFLCLTVGFLQDPLRKLWAEEPVYLTGLVALFLAASTLGAALQGKLFQLTKTDEWRTALRRPVAVFTAGVAAQAVHTWGRYDNPQMAAIGLVAYLVPLAAALVGYSFAVSARSIRRFLIWYVVLSAGAAVGVYLGFLGYESRVLEQVGPGLIVFSNGMPLEAYPGFLRSPEVAAWHAGAGVAFLVILGTLTKRSGARFVIGLLVVFLVGAALLTGRRKVLVEIALFLVAYWLLLAYARLGARKLATLGLVTAAMAAVVVLQLPEPREGGPSFDPYLQHGMTGFADAPPRFGWLGLGSIEWAIQRHGVLGAGAGTGSQGAQHFGGGASLVGGAAEGGLGKVVTELGLLGLLAALWVGTAVGRSLWRRLKGVSRLDPGLVTLGYGLAAFLGANAITFVAASQVYGDAFVLVLLGAASGFVMRVPRLVGRPPGGPAAGTVTAWGWRPRARKMARP